MKAKGASRAEASIDDTPAPATKLDKLVAMLRKQGGASITELSAGAGWQAHSVRGAMAGALKKRGHAIVSEKLDGVRRYRIEPTS